MIDWVFRAMTKKGAAVQPTANVTKALNLNCKLQIGTKATSLRTLVTVSFLCTCTWLLHPFTITHASYTIEGGHKSVLSQQNAKPPFYGAEILIAFSCFISDIGLNYVIFEWFNKHYHVICVIDVKPILFFITTYTMYTCTRLYTIIIIYRNIIYNKV